MTTPERDGRREPGNYLVDTQDGLPTLVDDGSKAYLHADGVLSEVGASGATQLLGDAIGSVRGLADGNGSLVGSRSYEAFGSPRTTSGTSSLFGFTGEPTDATGLVYPKPDPSIRRRDECCPLTPCNRMVPGRRASTCMCT
jgi:hypothetical protein